MLQQLKGLVTDLLQRLMNQSAVHLPLLRGKVQYNHCTALIMVDTTSYQRFWENTLIFGTQQIPVIAARLDIGMSNVSSILVDGDHHHSVAGMRKNLRDPRRNLTAQQTVYGQTAGILFTLLQQLEQAFFLLLHPFEGQIQEGQLILVHYAHINLRAYRLHQLPQGPDSQVARKMASSVPSTMIAPSAE